MKLVALATIHIGGTPIKSPNGGRSKPNVTIVKKGEEFTTDNDTAKSLIERGKAAKTNSEEAAVAKQEVQDVADKSNAKDEAKK
jgi:hypothetical protein